MRLDDTSETYNLCSNNAVNFFYFVSIKSKVECIRLSLLRHGNTTPVDSPSTTGGLHPHRRTFTPLHWLGEKQGGIEGSRCCGRLDGNTAPVDSPGELEPSDFLQPGSRVVPLLAKDSHKLTAPPTSWNNVQNSLFVEPISAYYYYCVYPLLEATATIILFIFREERTQTQSNVVWCHHVFSNMFERNVLFSQNIFMSTTQFSVHYLIAEQSFDVFGTCVDLILLLSFWVSQRSLLHTRDSSTIQENTKHLNASRTRGRFQFSSSPARLCPGRESRLEWPRSTLVDHLRNVPMTQSQML